MTHPEGSGAGIHLLPFPVPILTIPGDVRDREPHKDIGIAPKTAAKGGLSGKAQHWWDCWRYSMDPEAPARSGRAQRGLATVPLTLQSHNRFCHTPVKGANACKGSESLTSSASPTSSRSKTSMAPFARSASRWS